MPPKFKKNGHKEIVVVWVNLESTDGRAVYFFTASVNFTTIVINKV